MSGHLITWPSLKEKVYEEQPFLIDPYIPVDSIVFLFGATSTGKSPTSWEMARAIGTGQSFFGLPTRKGKVLYIDCDSPERVAAERLRMVEHPPSEVFFYFTAPLSIPNVGVEQMEELVKVRDMVQPDVVFLNTLRKVHDLDDKDSKTPKVVYSFFQYLFPNTALVFIHHPRKSQTGQGVVEVKRETFSGSMAWLNDAQVGLMLQKYNAPDGLSNLRLYHVKSQATQLVKPLPLFLADDGVSLSSPLFKELLCVYETFHAHYGKSKGEIDKVVAATLGCSVATARRRREEIEKGHFPGSRRWLGRDDEEE